MSDALSPAARAALALQAGQADLALQLVAASGMEDPAILLVRGLAQLTLQDWLAAASTFARACARYPQNGAFFFNRALALENLGEISDALLALQTAMDLGYAPPEAFGNLANLFLKGGRVAESEQAARQALNKGLDKAKALNALGLALTRRGRWDSAAQAFAEALQGRPGDPLILANRANLAADRLDFAQAFADFAAARQSDDNASFRRDEAMARLLSGDFAQGWPLYESRLEIPRAFTPPPCIPRWQGEDIAGKTLLLIAEQGLGDTLQFCRYGAPLQERGARLIWRVQPSLIRLLAANLSGCVTGNDAPWPQADFYLPLLSLPLATEQLQPCGGVPYLHAPAHAKMNLSDAPKIGLVWKGSPTHRRDGERSIPLSALAPLWEACPAAQFYALLPDGAADIAACDAKITDLAPSLHDFADTAAVLSQMDALVTVDTAAAHLAGALGIRTLLLLPFCPDWRWGTEGTTTPWYQTLSLYRQKTPQDWPPVLTALAADLPALLSPKGRGRFKAPLPLC